MAEESSTVSPPYATYRQFVSFLNGLRETTVPSRIDRSVFGNMSGGTAYSLLSALKFLKLIDNDGTPQTMLRSLVAVDEQDRKLLIAEMLKDAYPTMFSGQINLAEASSGQFNEHLRDQFSIKGSTIDKVALFFLAAAEDAGVAVSAHLKSRKPTSTSPANRKRTVRKADGNAGLQTPLAIPVVRHEPKRALSHILTDMLDVTDMTDEEMQAVWILLRYQKRKEAAQAAAAAEK